MANYDIVKKYGIPNVYNVLFLESELNQMQRDQYELKKIDKKDMFYFKKQVQPEHI